ncbi:MAG TPA: hypothetical protein RMH99_26025 [Sandaracinaceae bacterium LLY-WYZ-13_1]|nr:hypothetical protein [Sandaracinaceae bacterium LLY-WYZ-13_1]
MTRTRTLLALLTLLAVFALSLVAAVAHAQATVVVRVRTADGDPAEATVTLTPQGGGTGPRSCRTSDGTCRLNGVSAGRYVVSAQPISGGRAPIPRPVPIPPSGRVTVSVTLR